MKTILFKCKSKDFQMCLAEAVKKLEESKKTEGKDETLHKR